MMLALHGMEGGQLYSSDLACLSYLQFYYGIDSLSNLIPVISALLVIVSSTIR